MDVVQLLALRCRSGACLEERAEHVVAQMHPPEVCRVLREKPVVVDERRKRRGGLLVSARSRTRRILSRGRLLGRRGRLLRRGFDYEELVVTSQAK
eukprot:12412123-Heterocapsa_arctica.AAC.1